MRVSLWFVVLLSLLVTACATPRNPARAVTTPPESQSLLEERVRLGATLEQNDVFEVRVYGQAQLSGLYRVSSEGTIAFPLLGVLKVAGKTTSEIESELSARLQADFLQNAYVSILIKEFNSKKVFVFGQVQKPGTFSFEENLTLIQALTLAGGFTAQAARARVSITRRENGADARRIVDVEEIANGKEANPKLMPGDIVFVPETYF